MNWYKKAEQWYKFAPTLTLYHGTTERNLLSITKNGFKPFNPEEVIDQTLWEYGYTRDMVPEWIWKDELNYRKDRPYIFFTTSKKQAKSYADKSYGEFQSSIANALIAWRKEGGISLSKKEYKPVVVTIDVPWEMVDGHKSVAELKEIYQNILSKQDSLLGDETLEEFLNNIGYEYWAKNPIPKEYITEWEYV